MDACSLSFAGVAVNEKNTAGREPESHVFEGPTYLAARAFRGEEGWNSPAHGALVLEEVVAGHGVDFRVVALVPGNMKLAAR